MFEVASPAIEKASVVVGKKSNYHELLSVLQRPVRTERTAAAPGVGSLAAWVVGKRMAELRERAGLTIRQAAEKIGVSAACLLRSEHGKRVFDGMEIGIALGVYGVPRERAGVMAVQERAVLRDRGALVLDPVMMDTVVSWTTGVVSFTPGVIPDARASRALAMGVSRGGVRVAGCCVNGLGRTGAGRTQTPAIVGKRELLLIVDELALERGGSRELAVVAERLPGAVRVIPRHSRYNPVGAFTQYSFDKRGPVTESHHTVGAGLYDADSGDVIRDLLGAALDPNVSTRLVQDHAERTR
jgi:DNA-binding XRE family transcriptional regulator